MPSESSPKLDARDEALALALAKGLSRAEAARAARLSPRTIRRRLADPAFRDRVAALRGELTEGVVGRLAGLAGKSLDALETLLTAESEGVRLQAATTVLSHLLRYREHVDLAAKVEALEAAAERVKGQPWG